MIQWLAQETRLSLFVFFLIMLLPAVRPALAFAQANSPQTTATPPISSASSPTFDVAAIHPHEPLPHEHNSITSSPWDGHFHAENVSVLMLIRWAFEMPETRILDIPGWVNSTQYDIEAKSDPSLDAQLKALGSVAARKQKEKMVQALLRDRFKLVTHTETRQLPIYALVVAKDDPMLGVVHDQGTVVNHGRDYIEVQASDSIAVLAEELSKEVGRDVIDRTGIEGRYDLKLKWAPDDASAPQLVNGIPADPAPPIFTAIQEQLGLKLEPGKAPVPVLVVDHAEQPSEN